ncbi:hypothetical protein Tsp_12778 [Trichinella spiralis]|uniref:hypothetical protein n=1 Tax=Trichinella spiralis TaxID=6334 RepID=UPI0001EFEF45|nr:hypothetical protein Tsp_12778 [Trichinella spiralis]
MNTFIPTVSLADYTFSFAHDWKKCHAMSGGSFMCPGLGWLLTISLVCNKLMMISRVNLLINHSIAIQCSALNVNMSYSKRYLITCIRWILILWANFPNISQATSKCQNAAGAGDADWAIFI